MSVFSSDVFAEVRRLVEVADPETTPYVSKYAAVKLLKAMREEEEEKEKKTAGDGGGGGGGASAALLGAIDCRLAKIHLDTEEPHEAEKRLEACLAAVEPEQWSGKSLSLTQGRRRRGGGGLCVRVSSLPMAASKLSPSLSLPALTAMLVPLCFSRSRVPMARRLSRRSRWRRVDCDDGNGGRGGRETDV